MAEEYSSIDYEEIIVMLPISEIDDHPNNSNPGANCSVDGNGNLVVSDGVREAHARQDLAYHYIRNGGLPSNSLVEISYSNGDSEIYVVPSMTAPPKAIMGTCKQANP